MTVGVQSKSATGVSWTVTVSVAELEPEVLVTHSVTTKSPKPVYSWVGFCAVDVPPSPKSHHHSSGSLLVSAKAQRWGVYDDVSGVLDVHAKPDPADLELLDLCVTRTLDHGGKVFALPPERMPGKAPAAAVFRY